MRDQIPFHNFRQSHLLFTVLGKLSRGAPENCRRDKLAALGGRANQGPSLREKCENIQMK